MEEFAPGQKRGTCCTKHRRFTWDLRRSCPPRLDGSMELFSAIKKNATTPGGGGQSNLMFSFFLFCWTGEMAPVGCGVDRGSRNFFPLSSSAAAAAAAAAASFTYNRVGWILLCIKKPSSAASRVLRPLLLWVKGTPDCFLSDRSGRAGSPELLSSELSVCPSN